MPETVLLCTVGGSHQPVLKAIRVNSPDHVCFFCTGRDPVSGRHGSKDQVTGSGNVIRAGRDDPRPSLPSIPVQAGLVRERFEARVVAADDLQAAFSAMQAAIADLCVRFPGARFVADYTGGTKTMTAALVCASLDSDQIELQLVTGPRLDLDRVRDGTEQAMRTSVERLRLNRAMRSCLQAWNQFAYGEAAEGLDAICIGTDSPDLVRLSLARALSHAFALWDAFDHKEALRRLNGYGKYVMEAYPNLLPLLNLLSGGDSDKSEPARLFDLWLNARRRAAQGRFDDAVARVYRLLEWTAQWQLKTRLGLDTATFPVDRLPLGVATPVGEDSTTRIGLSSAWHVVAENLEGPLKDFYVDHRARMIDILEIRNSSILAHGYKPVSRDSWRKFETWIEESFLPVLQSVARDAGLRPELWQLPREPPSAVTLASGDRFKSLDVAG